MTCYYVNTSADEGIDASLVPSLFFSEVISQGHSIRRVQVVGVVLVENLPPCRVKSLPLLARAIHSGDTDALVLAAICLITAIEIAFQDHEKMILRGGLRGDRSDSATEKHETYKESVHGDQSISGFRQAIDRRCTLPSIGATSRSSGRITGYSEVTRFLDESVRTGEVFPRRFCSWAEGLVSCGAVCGTRPTHWVGAPVVP